MIEEIRSKLEELTTLIRRELASTRENSLAVTKLEEAAMWFERGNPRKPEAQQGLSSPSPTGCQ